MNLHEPEIYDDIENIAHIIALMYRYHKTGVVVFRCTAKNLDKRQNTSIL